MFQQSQFSGEQVSHRTQLCSMEEVLWTSMEMVFFDQPLILMHPSWIRALRIVCRRAQIAFFALKGDISPAVGNLNIKFKQWFIVWAEIAASRFWQTESSCDQFSAKVGRKWKLPKGIGKSEMDIFWCISMKTMHCNVWNHAKKWNGSNRQLQWFYNVLHSFCLFSCVIKVSKTLPADLQILVLAITMNDMEVGRKLVKVLTYNGSGTIDNFVHSLTGPPKPIR